MTPFILIFAGVFSAGLGVAQLLGKKKDAPASDKEKVPSFQPKKKSEEELKGE